MGDITETARTAQHEDILALYDAGMAIVDLAEIYQIPVMRILSLLVSTGRLLRNTGSVWESVLRRMAGGDDGAGARQEQERRERARQAHNAAQRRYFGRAGGFKDKNKSAWRDERKEPEWDTLRKRRPGDVDG